MSEDRKRILEMIASGKVSVAEGEELLDALREGPAAAPAGARAGRRPKNLRVEVTEAGSRVVNIRVPLSLVRSGLRLASVLPEGARGKVEAALGDRNLGFDLGNLKAEEFDRIIGELSDLEINVDDEADRVRIFVE